jgi:hypothetical protein
MHPGPTFASPNNTGSLTSFPPKNEVDVISKPPNADLSPDSFSLDITDCLY